MKKRTLWIGVVGIAAIVVILLAVLNWRTSSPQGITIGAILPLTGDAGSYGVGMKRGMDLALETVTDEGGIHGKKLSIIFEDSQADPAKTVNAFNKLRSVDRVPMVLGDMFSPGTLAIAPIAERNKVVLLSPSASAVELTHAGDYIFRIYPSDTYDGSYLARYARDNLHAEKVAIISMQTASITAVVDVFRTNFEGAGGRVVALETYKEGDVDFRTQLIKAKAVEPDLIFIPGYLKEMALLLRQAKQLGVSGLFLSISTFFDPKIFELAGDAAEGVRFSSPAYDPESASPEVQAFVKSFRTRHGQQPDILAAYGYDVVMIAAKALRTAVDIEPTSIKAALYAIQDYPGVTGVTSFDANGDVTKQLRMMTVKNGSFTPAQ